MSNLLKLNSINQLAEKLYHSNPANPSKYFLNLSDSGVATFLQTIHDKDVRYLIVGGVATAFHGHVRTTLDLDLWIKDEPSNNTKLIEALECLNVTTLYNVRECRTLKIGSKGLEVDLWTNLRKFRTEDFDAVYTRSMKVNFDDVPLVIIGCDDLIDEKKSGKNWDLDDIENLEKIQNQSK